MASSPVSEEQEVEPKAMDDDWSIFKPPIGKKELFRISPLALMEHADRNNRDREKQMKDDHAFLPCFFRQLSSRR